MKRTFRAYGTTVDSDKPTTRMVDAVVEADARDQLERMGFRVERLVELENTHLAQATPEAKRKTDPISLMRVTALVLIVAGIVGLLSSLLPERVLLGTPPLLIKLIGLAPHAVFLGVLTGVWSTLIRIHRRLADD